MTKTRVAILALLILASCLPARAANTVLILNSQPGDYIGGGITQTFPAVTVSSIYNGGVQATVPGGSWDLDFGPLSGRSLTVGEYEGAERFAFHSPLRPGLDVSGDARGCNTVTGRFLVSDISFAADGSIQTLAIDFEQHCEGAPPALFGSVRYNSNAPIIPRVSIADTTALKGNAGTNDVLVPVSLCMPSNQTVTVWFATSNGTAISEKQYLPTAAKVTFPAGSTSQTIRIPIIGDRLADGTKSFHVSLKYPTGAPIGGGVATITILDPNVALSVLSMYGQPGDYISPGHRLVTTADALFTATRNFDQGVSVSLENLDSWRLDFAAPNSVPLVPGSYGNAQRYPFQGPGTPGLDVSGPGGCNTLTGRFDVLTASYSPTGDVQAFAADFEQHCEGAAPALFGSIRINANLRQLSVSNAVVDSAETKAVFTVTLNPASTSTVWVNFNTADDTAITGGDYYATTQTIQFAPGQTQHTVTVPLVVQPKDGPNKRFLGQLSAPSGAAIWIAEASAVI